MKSSFAIILLIFAIMVSACRQKQPAVTTNPWTELTITSEDHTLITIYPDSDTVHVKVYNTGTIFYRPKKVTTDTLKFVFSKAERDSIFLLAREIIATPPVIQKHCTDAVGDLHLKIYYAENCIQEVNFWDICNWNTLSNKTIALHDLLKRRMKKVFLGENVL